MTPEQEAKCRSIIHSHALAAAAGNAIPVPSLGLAADMVAMTTMCIRLCGVFGGNMSDAAAQAMAITALKNSMLKQPIKIMTKELSKFVPVLGSVVAPGISAVVAEAAGWVVAKDLDKKYSHHPK